MVKRTVAFMILKMGLKDFFVWLDSPRLLLFVYGWSGISELTLWSPFIGFIILRACHTQA